MLYATGKMHFLSSMLTRVSGRSTSKLAQDKLDQQVGVTILQ
ncbi:hypothetical protein FHS99_003119 [Sphingomonas prati]|uniref:Uncharacterized protein n=1 Tax=Sphingomonas prati TaxID=1843237 RepID=A0A7W9BV61_9SPHN|nr:hypothetical protein [Sphingomonas prati]